MVTPPTGRPRGRPKGGHNKSTKQRLAESEEAAEIVIKVLGEHGFQGDAHALFMAVYKNEALPLETRLDAAKAAIRFEKPALAAIALPENREEIPGDGARLINGAQVIDHDPLLNSLKAWGNTAKAN